MCSLNNAVMDSSVLNMAHTASLLCEACWGLLNHPAPSWTMSVVWGPRQRDRANTQIQPSRSPGQYTCWGGEHAGLQELVVSILAEGQSPGTILWFTAASYRCFWGATGCQQDGEGASGWHLP